MKNNYDPIAEKYDWLSKLMFRQSLVISQVCLLPHIPYGSNILIAGGGTGWILEEIAKVHPSGLSITYVELSEKMIFLAEKWNVGKNQVVFVNKAIEDYHSSQKFDIIFTAFLFDNFRFEKVETVFQHLNHLLKNNGKWLFADFYMDEKSKYWHRLLLKSMLFFFRIICKIEARNLVPVEPFFNENGFEEIFSRSQYQGFIKSLIYVKTEKS